MRDLDWDQSILGKITNAAQQVATETAQEDREAHLTLMRLLSLAHKNSRGGTAKQYPRIGDFFGKLNLDVPVVTVLSNFNAYITNPRLSSMAKETAQKVLQVTGDLSQEYYWGMPIRNDRSSCVSGSSTPFERNGQRNKSRQDDPHWQALNALFAPEL
jgi:hypothetical protein